MWKLIMSKLKIKRVGNAHRKRIDSRLCLRAIMNCLKQGRNDSFRCTVSTKSLVSDILNFEFVSPACRQGRNSDIRISNLGQNILVLYRYLARPATSPTTSFWRVPFACPFWYPPEQVFRAGRRGRVLITILIFLSTNTFATIFAGDVISGNPISFNEREKEGSGSSAKQYGITDYAIANSINNVLLANTLVDLKANGNNAKDSNMSMFIISLQIAIRQPLNIFLIISAILGLFLRLLRKKYCKLKPLTDYCVSFIGLLIVSPAFFVVGLIIKMTSSGPVFYIQERVGKDGRLFNIIKFRTMHVNAESQTGPVWAGRNDMYITTFGRFLRKTHMDELPQLINVIRGEMSVIGPRPERPFFVSRFKENIPGYSKRLSVKPGITGLAQCYHRYDETIRDVHRKLRYDILYINRMCWMLDFRILWRTLTVSLLEGR
jgi:lipopolysaccharide/colanic/teichoic acid biosynthesis glycosyltransferase